MLRPLVRLLIQCGIGFPALADLLRGLYVDVARRDLVAEPLARTDSRISLMTGVHRKEIRRQRTLETPEEPQAVSVSSQVIGRWLGMPGLVGPDGAPLPLPRLGASPSFEALVTAVTTDIRPRALLDTWLDQGLATLDADDRVVLRQTAFLPQADTESRLFYFGRNLADHLAAAGQNLVSGDAPPFLDRSVHYDGLSEAAAAAIEAVARRISNDALLEVNRAALAIADADDAAAAASGGAGAVRPHRVNFGVFVFKAVDTPKVAPDGGAVA